MRWGPGVRVGSGQGVEGSAGEMGAWGQGDLWQGRGVGWALPGVRVGSRAGWGWKCG